jgi:hypothetical protein
VSRRGVGGDPEQTFDREPRGRCLAVQTPEKSGGGDALRAAVTAAHDLDGAQVVLLEEACRAKDRLDFLALDSWPDSRFTIDDPDRAIIGTAQTMKKLIAAMRLPDKHGRRPQRRSARGVYGGRR